MKRNHEACNNKNNRSMYYNKIQKLLFCLILIITNVFFFFYKLESKSLKKYIAYVLKGMCDRRTHFIYFKYS